jgi:hypothetical protein
MAVGVGGTEQEGMRRTGVGDKSWQKPDNSIRRQRSYRAACEGKTKAFRIVHIKHAVPCHRRFGHLYESKA